MPAAAPGGIFRSVTLRLPQAELANVYSLQTRSLPNNGSSAQASAWARLNRSLEVVTYAMSSESMPLFLYGPSCERGSSLMNSLDATAVSEATGRHLPGYYLRGGSTEECTELVEAVDADLSGTMVLVSPEELSELDNLMDAVGDYARVVCVLRGGEMAYMYAGPDTMRLYVSEFCPLESDDIG